MIQAQTDTKLTLEANLGVALTQTIENLMDYKNSLEYQGHTFSREELEENIWDGFFGYVKVGLSLKSMARYRRYEKECKSFKSYCQKYLRISAGYAKKIMEATEVWLELVLAGFEILPNCVSQAMPLIKFNTGIDLEGNCQLWDKWQECINYATATNQRMTATLVSKVVDGKNPPKQIKVDNDLWNLISEQAAKVGLSKKDFLRRTVEQYINPSPPTEPTEPEARKRWQQDLEDLVSEHDRSEASDVTPTSELQDEGSNLNQEVDRYDSAIESILKFDKTEVRTESKEPVTAMDEQLYDVYPPLWDRSKLSISFGKTVTPLLNGQKTVTRRQWSCSTVEKFAIAYEKGKWIRALNKADSAGGEQVGWIKLTKAPYEDLLCNIHQNDCQKEGYPELTPQQFVKRFFGSDIQSKVWVLEFEFILSGLRHEKPKQSI